MNFSLLFGFSLANESSQAKKTWSPFVGSLSQSFGSTQRHGYDVTVGFHKDVPGAQQAPGGNEDEEVTIARQEREKTAQDPVVQELAKRLGVPVHFLLDYRERAIGQFGPRLDRIENEANQPPPGQGAS
jgi:hypothetical protein